MGYSQRWVGEGGATSTNFSLPTSLTPLPRSGLVVSASLLTPSLPALPGVGGLPEACNRQAGTTHNHTY